MNKLKANKLLQLLICSLFLIPTCEIFAQDMGNQPERVRDLINQRKINIPEVAQRKIQYFKAFKEYKKVHAVQLPEKLYEEEVLSLYIDVNKRELRFNKHNGTEIQIVKREITVFSDSIYIWKGDIYDPTSDEAVGDAMLVQNQKGEITGTIDVAGLIFQIRSLGASGLSAIIEYDEEEVNRQNKRREEIGSPLHDGGTSKGNAIEMHSEQEYSLRNDQPQWVSFEAENTISNQMLTSNTSCPKPIARVLVLYTAGAASYGNINNIIAQAITETNDAYGNSNTGTTVVLQHSQQVSFVENVTIKNDLDRLMADPTYMNLRNQYDADIVVMLTSANAYFLSGGRAGTLRAESDKAYAIVDVSNATSPAFTFGHEIGHIQGAQHHPDDFVNIEEALYPYGYGHRITYSCGFLGLGTCKKATIMAYTSGGYSRIKYFSNPNVTYSGKSLGITGERENYKVLYNTREIVANFRDANEVNAGISYTRGTRSQYGQNFTFVDNSCGGNGSYSFEWRISLNNPTNFGDILSTSSSYFVALSSGTWYIQLKVTTSTGQTSIKVISVVVSDNNNGGGGIGGPGGPIPKIVHPNNEDNNDFPETVQLLPAYPNPFNPNTNISFQLPVTGHVKINIYDLNGREVSVLADQVFSAGTHQMLLNASDLSSGTYIIRLQTGSTVETQTLTLIK